MQKSFKEVPRSFSFLRIYLTKEVEQNFMKQSFLVNKRKRLNTIFEMVSGQLPLRKIVPRLGLGFGLGLGLVSELGAIFLGGNCPRTLCNKT